MAPATTAYAFCNNCDKSFPSRYDVCQHCHGGLTNVVLPTQTPSVHPPSTPIQDMLTIERLIDELCVHLSIIEEVSDGGVCVRKYPAQARNLMYEIQVRRPIPRYTINSGDLTERLRRELESLAKGNRRGFEYVVKSAVARIFEAINLEYYTISVAPFLVVKIES